MLVDSILRLTTASVTLHVKDAPVFVAWWKEGSGFRKKDTSWQMDLEHTYKRHNSLFRVEHAEMTLTQCRIKPRIPRVGMDDRVIKLHNI